MAQTGGVGGHVEGLGTTHRRDSWWVGPAVTFAVFSGWLLYFFWAASQGRYFSAGPYVSPFYLTFEPAHDPMVQQPTAALWGYWPSSWPNWLSPALFIGGLPGMFRLTCYYYRKAYYRTFFGMPPGCAVGPVPMDYRGETGLLIVQNLHRYTLYIAILLLPLLLLDAVHAMSWNGQLGFGIGTILLLINTVLLAGYTLGCHAWRHLIGGKLNCFSCDGVSEARHGAWTFTTWLNQNHMQWAWASLLWILMCDVYIRLVSMGVLPDVNTWHGITWVGDF